MFNTVVPARNGVHARCVCIPMMVIFVDVAVGAARGRSPERPSVLCTTHGIDANVGQ
jgi:hypothetical protein